MRPTHARLVSVRAGELALPLRAPPAARRTGGSGPRPRRHRWAWCRRASVCRLGRRPRRTASPYSRRRRPRSWARQTLARTASCERAAGSGARSIAREQLRLGAGGTAHLPAAADAASADARLAQRGREHLRGCTRASAHRTQCPSSAARAHLREPLPSVSFTRSSTTHGPGARRLQAGARETAGSVEDWTTLRADVRPSEVLPESFGEAKTRARLAARPFLCVARRSRTFARPVVGGSSSSEHERRRRISRRCRRQLIFCKARGDDQCARCSFVGRVYAAS